MGVGPSDALAALAVFLALFTLGNGWSISISCSPLSARSLASTFFLLAESTILMPYRHQGISAFAAVHRNWSAAVSTSGLNAHFLEAAGQVQKQHCPP